jgi:hypothetical protein
MQPKASRTMREVWNAGLMGLGMAGAMIGSAGAAPGVGAGIGVVAPAVAPAVVAGPTVTVSPSLLGFAPTTVGTTRSMDLVVANTTGGIIVATGWRTDNGDFSVPAPGNAFANVLFPGAIERVPINFRPHTTGASRATVSFQIGSQTTTAKLEGTGIAPRSQVDVARVDFGEQELGVLSAPRRVTITNNGTAAGEYRMTWYGHGSSFGIDNEPVVVNLAPGATRTLDMLCKPKSVGPLACTVAFEDANSGDVVMLPLTAQGIPHPGQDAGAVAPAPEVEVSLTQIDFGSLRPGNSAAREVTITNRGNAPLVLQSFSIAGVDRQAFGVAGNLQGVLAPQEARTVTVSFRPWDLGARGALLRIQHNGPGEVTTVPLAGIGGEEDRPAVIQPPVDPPGVDQPVVDQPVVDQPGMDQPADEPGIDPPAVDQPEIDPPADQPGDQPAIDQPNNPPGDDLLDMDGDGIPDAADPDMDGDGILDAADAG